MRQSAKIIHHLHKEIWRGARDPIFYAEWHVADNLEGRFEILTLQASLLLNRLHQAPAPGPECAQDLIDLLFQTLDSNLREMGVSDTALPKRIKKFAHAFLGRLQIYQTCLSCEERPVRPHAALETALLRNIYEKEPDTTAEAEPGLAENKAWHPLTDYTCQTWNTLQDLALKEILTEQFIWPQPYSFPAPLPTLKKSSDK